DDPLARLEWDAQHIFRDIPGALGDVRGVAWIACHVGNGNRLASDRHQTGDASAKRQAKSSQLFHALAEGDLEHQLLGLFVNQEQRSVAGADGLGGQIDDGLENTEMRRYLAVSSQIDID